MHVRKYDMMMLVRHAKDGKARRWADAPQAVPKAGCRDVGRYGVPHTIPDEI